ncbi:hypothetical protein [Acidocella sp.]|uniref:hypothetical protein n=1 Tax=Acidocella sp. TaxID=50710 RepID=UPI003D01BF2B
MAGFLFLAAFAPAMYIIFVPVIMSSGTIGSAWFEGLFSAGLIWGLLVVGGVIGPARFGKIWAIRLMRVMSYAAMVAYVCALVWDVFLYFHLKPPLNQGCVWVFEGFFLPLGICAVLLLRALRREPWFDPEATLERIGPSLGAPAEAMRSAGLDMFGRLSEAQRGKTLAMGQPPRRWLCYVFPPYVTARLHRWGWFAVMLPICLAALVFAIVIPLRALVVYGFMGGLADRFRVLQLLRLDAAQAVPPPDAPRTQKRRPAKPESLT